MSSTYIPSNLYGGNQPSGDENLFPSGVRGNIKGASTTNFLSGGNVLKEITARNKIVNGMDDPSHLGFNFIIVKNYPNSGLFGGETQDDNLSRITDVGYSALRYLRDSVSHDIVQIGGYDDGLRYDEEGNIMEMYEPSETEKYSVLNPKGYQVFPNEYKNLKAFVDGFTDITNDHPYVFQTVEGLQDAYKRYFANSKDAFLGGGDENKIKIGCLESIDLRMLALFDSYFNAVYNHKYRRQVLPPNLLKFDCGILVHDIRNIAPGVWNTKTGSGFKIDEKLAKLIAENVSSVWFEFKDCVFDNDEIGDSFSEVSNAEQNETGFSFVIRYSNVEIHVNSLADAIENGETFIRNTITDHGTIYENERSRASKKLTEIDMGVSVGEGNGLQSLLNFGQNVFNSATSNSKFGNVYNDSITGLISNALSAVTTASASSIINGLASQGMHYLGDQIMENIPSGPMNNFIGNMTNGMHFNF